MLITNNKFHKNQQQTLTCFSYQVRKPYCKPVLEELGDLRALTFGSFIGGDESGPESGNPIQDV